MLQIKKLYTLVIISVSLLAILLIFSFISSSHFFTTLLLPLGLLVVVSLNVYAYILLKKNPQTSQLTEPILPEMKNLALGQQDKSKYEAILAYIGEGLVVIDKAGKIITFNKAAQSLLGWTEKEALGRQLTEVIKIDYDASISESKLTPTRQSSLYFMKKDGTKFPAAITTTSYATSGDILGTVTLFRDITMEQNIDKMKNEFISLASHQLRTPLAAIKWYTEMLLKGDAGKLLREQTDYANTIYTSTGRMIELVNLLLNISRIESGRITVEPLPTDLKKLVEEIVKEVQIRYADKNQKISINFHEPIPLINVDPRLIRQVYVNLLTNAAKYTPVKGVITVTLSQKDKDIISEVKDNGYGIPQADHDKLFGKFYRGLKTVTRENEGTGLGLYLVKDIIDLSHGKIWFKSKEGQGTSFWFSLPLAGTPPKKGVLTLEA